MSRFAAPTVASSSLLRNGAYLLAGTGVSAATGWLFWMVAARSMSRADVGLAGTLLNTMTITSVVATGGLGYALIGALPRIDSPSTRRELVVAVVALCGAAALVLSVAWLVVGPRLDGDLGDAMGAVPWWWVVGGTTLLTVSLVVDHAFIAHRRSGGTLARAAVVSVGKLLALVAFVAVGADGVRPVVAASIVAVIAALLTVTVTIRRRTVRAPLEVTRRGVRTAQPLMRSGALHHVATIGGEVPGLVLPVIVLVHVGPAAAAVAYTAWMVGGMYFAVSSSISGSLFAEGAHTLENLDAQTRTAAGVSLAACLGGGIVLLVIGGPLLGLLGPGYAAGGGPILSVLVLAGIPDALTNIGMARWKARSELRAVAILQVVQGGITIGLAWVLVGRVGPVGIAIAFLVAQCVGAVIVTIAYRSERHLSTPPLNTHDMAVSS